MTQKSKIIMGTNRSFGLVFFVVFFIIALWPLTNDGSIIMWSIVVSLIFLILGLINSKILTPLNKLWFKFGIFLGSIIAPIVMGIVFFLVVTPIGLIMKTLKKDLLNIKYNNKIKTYWIKCDKTNSSMKKQY